MNYKIWFFVACGLLLLSASVSFKFTTEYETKLKGKDIYNITLMNKGRYVDVYINEKKHYTWNVFEEPYYLVMSWGGVTGAYHVTSWGKEN